jgi:hypothetical protein
VTSSAANDGGLCETNLNDEPYLPFEGAGAISEWRLKLPAAVPQSDVDTMTDVNLRLRYQAREGGAPLRRPADGAWCARGRVPNSALAQQREHADGR